MGNQPGGEGVAEPAPSGLAAHEIAAFRRDGLVLPRCSIAASLVARLAALVSGGGRDAPRTPDDAIIAWARDARLAELVAPLLGSTVRLWRCTALSSAASTATPWRPDSTAWPDGPSAVVSVRVALDAADRDNGCVRLLPRSHERLVREIRNARHRRDLALPPDHVDRAIVVDAVRRSGELTLYDAQTLYCEPENRSARPRAAVTFHYVPAESGAEMGAVR